jgi:hypothetical protein
MSDMYTQESASKKKFLAPLLVILLCMVSLTGAGYAYSATIQGGGDAPVDEKFIIDLYEAGTDTVIDSKIHADAVDGLVFTTDKVIDDTNDIYGDFELENMTVVLYTGDVKVSAVLANGSTTTAGVVLSDLAAEFTSNIYAVENAAGDDDGSLTVEMNIYAYNGAERGAKVNLTDGKYVLDIGKAYNYEIVITAVDGKVQGSAADIAAMDADAFANNVLGDVKIDFGFKFTATAIEA